MFDVLITFCGVSVSRFGLFQRIQDIKQLNYLVNMCMNAAVVAYDNKYVENMLSG